MDTSQLLLFDGFPRTIGVTTPERESCELSQYTIHSRSEFDSVVESANGVRNLYCSISRFLPRREDGKYKDNVIEVDKVSFDLDSSAKAPSNAKEDWLHPLIPEQTTDSKIFRMMQENHRVRESILGDVCRDAHKLADRCSELDIPLIGVFTGFGLHCHLLFERTMRQIGKRMKSTYRRFVDKCTLSTADEKASGKPYRILRIPNVRRVDESDDESTPIDMYTIPLRHDELLDIDPDQLLELSREPRINIGVEPENRPSLDIQEGYAGAGTRTSIGQQRMREIPEDASDDRFVKHLVKRIVQMPCVYERAFGVNPPNDVRVKLGIMFLNAGFSPTEITDIIARLNWMNFDRETTKYQLKKLQESKRGDWSCQTMQAKGLCTRADQPRDCPAFGYRGGNKPTK